MISIIEVDRLKAKTRRERLELTQARARAELRELCTAEDARDVIDMVRTSFDDVFRDETGRLDFSRSQNGCGMSSRDQCKKLVAALVRHSDAAFKNVFDAAEIKEVARAAGLERVDLGAMLETLNNQGFLLKKGPKTYQLLVGDR